jgi:hypothetical protein
MTAGQTRGRWKLVAEVFDCPYRAWAVCCRTCNTLAVFAAGRLQRDNPPCRGCDHQRPRKPGRRCGACGGLVLRVFHHQPQGVSETLRCFACGKEGLHESAAAV